MRFLWLTLALAACGGDSDKTDTTTSSDTDADTDADTDTDTDADTDTDTDADTDTDPTTDSGFVVTDTGTPATTDTGTAITTDTGTSTTGGTPIASGCMAGIVPRIPASPLAPYVIGDDGELGFDAYAECGNNVFDVSFEASNFSADPDQVEVDLWDLANGRWLGEWPATASTSDLWVLQTSGNNPPATCADQLQLMFTGVGYLGGVPSAPTGTEDLTGNLTVWSAGYDLTGGGERAIGVVEAPGADEVWFWAVYPDLDEAYGPWLVPNTYAADHELDVDLLGNNLRADGMAFGFVSCAGGSITAAHGR